MDVPQIEAELAALAERLTAPLPGECLPCSLSRVLQDLRCAGVRCTPPLVGGGRRRADQVLRWALADAACDCEVLLLAPRSRLRERWTGPAALSALRGEEQGR